MTLTGSLSTYCKNQWNITSPKSTKIHWSENWFDPTYPDNPQISFTDLTSPQTQMFGSGGTQTIMYRPSFLVNVWNQIPRGSSGTAEAQNVENMRKEVARIFRAGMNGTYGGSLTPLLVCLPQDKGVARHELDKTPRTLRFELTLIGVSQNE